jgi:two-component sensor histidine kinase/HAMP domain-containing protein
MKILFKLLLGFMSLLIIMGLFGYFASRQNQLMASKLLFLQEGSLNEVLAAANLAIALHASYSGAQELVEESLRSKHFADGDSTAEAEIDHASEKIESALAEVSRQIDATKDATMRSIELAGQIDDEEMESEEQEEIDRWHQSISEAFSSYRQSLLGLTTITASGDLRRAAEVLETEVESAFRQNLLPLVSTFQKDSREELGKETRAILRSIENVQQTMAWGGGLLGVLAILLSVLLAKRISAPLERLSDAATKIRAGYAVTPFQSASHDEVGHLTTVFFEMVSTEQAQRREIEKAQIALGDQNQHLESIVIDRTAVLAATNLELGREIEEHRATEKQLAQSLVEKETMLKEIHHRVKNNMQIISSLLQMQKEQIQDPQVRVLMLESESRIRAMALVHEKLYQTESLARVNLGDYIDSLSRYLLQTYSKIKVDLQLHIEPLMISLDKAIPFGLILNELITNTLKHGFDESGQSGQIQITLKQDGSNACCLRVADNGKGLPPGFDWTRTNTLGMQLLAGLAQQIDARVTVATDCGTVIELTFTLDQ